MGFVRCGSRSSGRRCGPQRLGGEGGAGVRPRGLRKAGFDAAEQLGGAPRGLSRVVGRQDVELTVQMEDQLLLGVLGGISAGRRGAATCSRIGGGQRSHGAAPGGLGLSPGLPEGCALLARLGLAIEARWPRQAGRAS